MTEKDEIESKETEAKIDNNPDSKFSKVREHVKKNPWMLSTSILTIVVVILLVLNFTGGITGNVVSGSSASEIARDYIQGYFESSGISGDVEIKDIEKTSGIYKIYLTLDEEDLAPIYMTKDGKYLGSMSLIAPISQSLDEPIEVPKSDKPVVEAFVSPYCPYGLQFEKGLVPVYNLLKDKADINIKLMSPTHIQEEEPEIKRELCILEEYGKDMFFNYLDNVIYDSDAASCYNDYHGMNLQTNEPIESEHEGDGEHFINCMKPIIESAMTKVGIDKSKIDSCVSSKSEELYQDSVNYVSSQEVSGSPTLKINGVKVSSGRSPNQIKESICSAFNEEPSECNEELFDESYTAGIGLATGEGSTGAC